MTLASLASTVARINAVYVIRVVYEYRAYREIPVNALSLNAGLAYARCVEPRTDGQWKRKIKAVIVSASDRFLCDAQIDDASADPRDR